MDEIIATFRPDLFAGKHAGVRASSGIGLAMAQGFARLGATVIATGSSAAKLEAEKADLANKGIRFALLDVKWTARRSTPSSAPCPLRRAGQRRRHRSARGRVHRGDLSGGDRRQPQQRHAPRHGGAAAARPLQGVVINTASMLSYLADESVPAYGASKTGIVGLDPGAGPPLRQGRHPRQRHSNT